MREVKIRPVGNTHNGCAFSWRGQSWMAMLAPSSTRLVASPGSWCFELAVLFCWVVVLRWLLVNGSGRIYLWPVFSYIYCEFVNKGQSLVHERWMLCSALVPTLFMYRMHQQKSSTVPSLSSMMVKLGKEKIKAMERVTDHYVHLCHADFNLLSIVSGTCYFICLARCHLTF